MLKSTSFAALLLGLTLTLTACPAPNPIVETPALTLSATSVQAGTAVTIRPVFFGVDPTFSISPENAGTLTVNGGTATFTPRLDFSGTVTITATSGGRTIQATLIVTSPPVAPSLTASAASVQVGSVVTITASNFSGAPTFTVSPSDAGTLTADGNTATFAPAAAFEGTVTITATSGGQTASVILAVTAAPPTATLSLSSPTVQGGAPVTITAANFAVPPSFSVSDSEAGILTVNGSTATFTPNVEFTGTVTITATGGGKTASATLTVTAAESSLSSLSGTVVTVRPRSNPVSRPWSGGAGTVAVIGATSAERAPLPGSSGTIGEGGAFTVSLPTPPDSRLGPLLLLQPLMCSGTLSNSVVATDPSARSVFVGDLSITTPQIQEVAFSSDVEQFVEGTGSFAEGLVVYSDRPTRISGVSTCTTTSENSTYTERAVLDNVVLRRGWNTVRAEVSFDNTPNNPSRSRRYVNGSLPSTWLTFGR